MRTLTGIAGLFFIGSLAVYSGQVKQALGGNNSDGNGQAGNVKVLDAEPAAAPVGAEQPGIFNSPATVPTSSPTVIDVEGNAPVNAADSHHHGQSLTATQVAVSDAGTVEIHVSNANLLEVLRMLSLQSRRNIIASKEVSGTVTANLYNVTLPEALDAILHANGCAYREKGNFIYIYTTKEIAAQEKLARRLVTRVFRLYYTSAADAVAMIKPVLSPDGSVTPSTAASKGINTTSDAGSSASTSSSGDTGGNSYAGGDLLVVTDDSTKLDQVEALLKEIDHRPQQVLIEATILAATLTDNNSLGVNFSLMGGVRFDQIMSSPASAIQNLGTGSLTDPRTVTNSAGTSGANTATGLHSYGIGSTSPSGLNIGFLTNNISVFVSALEAVANTTVLANPKVMALDRQQAQVHVGKTDYYVASTTATQTTSTQQAQAFNTGTTLSFRPYVGSDGYIRMEIHPEDSTGGLVNGLPSAQITEVTSNVMVRDGHTIVIGGLFREQSTTQRTQVPGLGNIPFLGALFRQQQDTTTRQEIIILITPHILKDDTAYSELSEKELKRVEELRVGVRKGMMITGRERLAEAAYQNAQDELNKPSPDKDRATWDLNVATNLNPTFKEAIELKEKLTGRRVTAVDNSSVRTFVERAILADTATVSAGPPATAPARVEPNNLPSDVDSADKGPMEPAESGPVQ